ncbi:MAG: WcaF family extracellular polysaccharide biosynthesis acetyltransferase [Halothece sp.]
MYLNHYTTDDYTVGASLIKQILWYFLGCPLVRSYWLPFSGFKVFLLRLFGGKIGEGVRIKPGVLIKFPWRLSVGNYVWLGENLWIDNLAQVTIESHVCLSQGVYLCTGNHRWNDPNFKLITEPITIETGSWIAARAVIGPGVTIKKGAILALGSVTGKSLEAMTIYAGNPAQPIKKRIINNE